MSYILDALRKADAQRARDPSRGIHAQPATAAVAADTGRRRRGDWIAAMAAILVAAGAGWMWFSRPPVAAPPALSPSAPVVRVEPPPPPQPPLPATEVFPPAPEPVVAAPPKAAPAAVPAAVAPATQRTYSLAELPPDVQQALPKFSVSGGVYSENVAQRMLVVNGQVFNEGSEIAAGVVLEQIGPRVALLKFRGLRITQPY